MRSLLPPFLLMLAGCAPAEGGQRGGVVSLNPCSDQLLLALVPPRRISALSHYSRVAGATSLPLDVARRFRSTAGTAEEVIALSPDLVVASSFTPAATRTAFARAGLRTLYLDSPTTIAASKAQVSELARAVGAEATGIALRQQINAAVAEATSDAHTDTVISALLYINGDLVTGSGTLLDEMMRIAGFRDAAANYGLTMTGALPVETILSRPPAVILVPDGGGRSAMIRRRVLARTGKVVREIPFPRELINCGGPTIPAALQRLSAIRRQMRG